MWQSLKTRVRVNCWRKLAEGVAASVAVGDPVVVAGRLYTRDWTDDAGNHRTLYELEAVAVGHDLSRGRARFLRNRPGMTTSTVEDAEAERRVHGEATEPVPDAQAPASLDDRPFDDEFPPEFDVPRVGLSTRVDGTAGELDGLLDPFDDQPDGPAAEDGDDELAAEDGADDPAADESATDDPAAGEPGSADEVTAGAGSGRNRRGRRRTPVPA
ncbi:single-stranded DNA-binding protein [Micromonospora chersina]|uniref:single-stranded DNA-binding protein n=1 Tax=Micromonospora chersina TaxID=47854 RepID=UPI003F4CCA0B